MSKKNCTFAALKHAKPMRWKWITALHSFLRNEPPLEKKALVTTFVDASDWQEARQYQTGGTREKCWLISCQRTVQHIGFRTTASGTSWS